LHFTSGRLGRGANIDIKGNSGLTARDIALIQGRADIIELFGDHHPARPALPPEPETSAPDEDADAATEAVDDESPSLREEYLANAAL
jgi:ankyrin repeat protein